MKRLAFLKTGREPLQVSIPEDFQGDRSSEEKEIFLGTEPLMLTDDEIALCRTFCKTLPYKQDVVTAAVFLDEDDPLLSADHQKLNRIEKEAGLPNTEFASLGGQRSTYERVLLIREGGYLGQGSKQLQGV